MFIAALFPIGKIWKRSECPTMDEWIWHLYTMEYYSTLRRKEILPFVVLQMDLEGITMSEMNQTQKDKCKVSDIRVTYTK